MATSNSKLPISDNARCDCKIVAIEILLIASLFALHAGWHAPEVNEPNYLAKAKQYWNPDWCSGDFFLNSADAHVVFYWTFGWTTCVLPLPTAALIGRLLTCLLLAIGWQRLSSSIVPRSFFAAISAGLLVCLNHRFHMAGEWIVGGVEAKGFAYALVMLGLAQIVRHRWNLAWICLGAATAMHVLVGGWSLIAAFAVCTITHSRSDEPSFSSMLGGLTVGASLALVGLIPAVGLDRGVDPDIVDRAARVLVFHRLPHHLNPEKFFYAKDAFPALTEFGLRFIVMCGVWALLWWLCRGNERLRRANQFVGVAVLIAALGITLGTLTAGNPSLAAALLRFYWFRLADVMLPAGAALSAICLLQRIGSQSQLRSVAVLGVALAAVTWHYVLVGMNHWMMPAPAADLKLLTEKKLAKNLGRENYDQLLHTRYRDWLDICRAAREKTPADSIFLTPRRAHTFKWHASRSEVITWKEVPQDAVSVVDWWDRMRDIYRIDGQKGLLPSLTELSPEKIADIHKTYHCDYLLTWAGPPLDLPLIYNNESFALYRLVNDNAP